MCKCTIPCRGNRLSLFSGQISGEGGNRKSSKKSDSWRSAFGRGDLVLQLLPRLVGVVQKRRYGDPAIDRPPSKLAVLAANIRGSNPLSSDLVTELLTIKDILHFGIFHVSIF